MLRKWWKKLFSSRSGKEGLRHEEIEQLKRIAAAWKRLARCKFDSARVQMKRNEFGEWVPDKFGRQFIEHGAICYNNCSMELEDFISEIQSGISARTSEDQK